jgi:hypothetical protein
MINSKSYDGLNEGAQEGTTALSSAKGTDI